MNDFVFQMNRGPGISSSVIFIWGLFKDAVCSSGYVTPNDKVVNE